MPRFLLNRIARLMAPEGDGGGGAGGAGAAPPPPPAGGAGAPPPPAGHGIAWLPADVDAEIVGHVQNKGWASAADAAKAHRAAEQLIGADRAGRTITLPKDDADITTRQAMWTKLGWSGDANAYKLPVPEGADPKFATDMAALFSKHGIPVAAAQALTADWNVYQGNVAKAASDAQAAASAAADAQLEKDWGAERAARTEIARRAAVQLGLDAGALDTLEKGTGYVSVMKALAKVGDMLKEHGASGLDVNPGAFGMTPEGAQARKTELFADAAWRERAMKPGSAEANELKRLSTIIASTAQG